MDRSFTFAPRPLFFAYADIRIPGADAKTFPVRRIKGIPMIRSVYSFNAAAERNVFAQTVFPSAMHAHVQLFMATDAAKPEKIDAMLQIWDGFAGADGPVSQSGKQTRTITWTKKGTETLEYEFEDTSRFQGIPDLVGSELEAASAALMRVTSVFQTWMDVSAAGKPRVLLVSDPASGMKALVQITASSPAATEGTPTTTEGAPADEKKE